MALIKFLMVIALIFAMTFHSMSPAQASEKLIEQVAQVTTLAVNDWCDMKLKNRSSSLKTVYFCRTVQDNLASGCSAQSCKAAGEPDKQDVVELNHIVIQRLVAAGFINY